MISRAICSFIHHTRRLKAVIGARGCLADTSVSFITRGFLLTWEEVLDKVVYRDLRNPLEDSLILQQVPQLIKTKGQSECHVRRRYIIGRNVIVTFSVKSVEGRC